MTLSVDTMTPTLFLTTPDTNTLDLLGPYDPEPGTLCPSYVIVSTLRVIGYWEGGGGGPVCLCQLWTTTRVRFIWRESSVPAAVILTGCLGVLG